MIDDKKIEKAIEDYVRHSSVEDEYPGTEGEAFRAGANWAINGFLKDLWHDAKEEPEHNKQITYVRVNGIAKTIILNEEADKYNNTPSQIWHNICKNYKVACWFYIDDLFPEEGGEE